MAYQPEIEKLERKYQDDPARHFAQLAEQYRRADRLDEALDILAQHLAERPNYVSGLIVQGRCYLDRHDDASARETFERVLSLDAEHIIALKALADIADRAGDAPKAISWVERLLEVDPMNEEAQELVERLKTEGARPVTVEPPAQPEEAVEQGAESADQEAGAEATVDLDATEPMEAIEPAPSLPQTVQEPAISLDATLETTPAEPQPRLSSDGFTIEREQAPFETLAESETVDALAPDEIPESTPPATEDLGLEPTASMEGFAEPESEANLDVEPFDQDLAWGTGERQSREITAEDMEAAERAHDQDVEEVPVDEIMGLEPTAVGEESALTAESAAGETESAGEAGSAAAAGSAGYAADEADEADAQRTTHDALAEAEADARRTTHDAPEDAEAIEPRGSLTGLPLILPPEEEQAPEPAADEPEPAPVAGPAAAAGTDARDDEDLSPAEQAEPDLVVTETMGEIYARQGLTSEARDVYRRLVRDNPNETRFADRLAELEREAKTGAKPAAKPAARRSVAAAAGSQTARAMLTEILSAHAGQPAAPAHPADPAAPANPAAPQPMDSAFSSADDQPDEPPPSGNPTQPATDEVSLGSAFGEHPAETKKQEGDGFSFDEFFSGAPPTRPSSAKERPSHAERDEASDAAFKDWLKGLKG